MRRATRALMLVGMVLATAGCGLPTDGVETVDNAVVPYRLLEEDPERSDDNSDGQRPSLRNPLVFWVDEAGQLVPREPTDGCHVDADELVAGLLAELAAGPTQELREEGLATALPPDSGVDLVTVEGAEAQVNVDPGSQISADRLPIAIGQVVLTVTSAPNVDQVTLLSDGEAVQIPVAGGALVTSPVTAESYAALVPAKYRASAPFDERPSNGPRCPADR
jgi:spore germination protein GerM